MVIWKKAVLQLWKYWSIRRNPEEYARSIGVDVGENCRFLGVTPSTFGSEPYLIKIGNHVTVTSGVKFVTHDGGVWVFRDKYPDIDLIAPIQIGNNVFIGINVVVMPGVIIGDNCVIGAGAVVTKNIPSDTVAVGIPARPIKSLDEYWDKIQAQVVHLRSVSPDRKRSLYKEMYMYNR